MSAFISSTKLCSLSSVGSTLRILVKGTLIFSSDDRLGRRLEVQWTEGRHLVVLLLTPDDSSGMARAVCFFLILQFYRRTCSTFCPREICRDSV